MVEIRSWISNGVCKSVDHMKFTSREIRVRTQSLCLHKIFMRDDSAFQKFTYLFNLLLVAIVPCNNNNEHFTLTPDNGISPPSSSKMACLGQCDAFGEQSA